jgi:hypothetical protein
MGGSRKRGRGGHLPACFGSMLKYAHKAFFPKPEKKSEPIIRLDLYL